MPSKKAPKPTRWWASVDTWGEFPPEIVLTRKEARADAWEFNDIYDHPGRFVVRRVEVREV